MRLTIITINRNNAEGLRKTIKSVVDQTFTDYEYIVIDGASLDGSIHVIKEFENRISTWISEKDNGIYCAMNKGLKLAHGEYVYFLNSGDFLSTEYSLTNIFNNIKSSERFDFIFTDTKVKINNKILRRRIPQILSFYYVYRTGINHQATITKRLIILENGYDENILAADWKFLITSLALKQCTYIVVNSVLAEYDTTGVSSSNKGSLKINKEKEEIFSSLFQFFKPDYIRYIKLNKFSKSGIVNIFISKYKYLIMNNRLFAYGDRFINKLLKIKKNDQ